MKKPSFYTYLIDEDIHYLDYRVHLTMELGESRLKELYDYISSLDIGEKNLKIIMDARNFTYDREETHLTMSKKSRKLFNEFNNFYLGIIHDNFEADISVNEKWFLTKESAIVWLKTII